MADNISVTPGAGASVATDQVGADHHQLVKPTFGTDGVATMVSRSNPLPVDINQDSAAFGRLRANTFRTPGRAGTAGQRLLTLWNPPANDRALKVNGVYVDLAVTVIKAVTVLPPLIRVHRFAVAPTSGNTLTKTLKDTTGAADAEVEVRGDASADGTLSTTALTVSLVGAMLTQEFAPRLITAAGYEMFDRTVLLEDQNVILRAGEGLLLNLDYSLATQNPATDMWVAGIDWTEL